MLRQRTRTNISIVLVMALLLVTGVVWSMGKTSDGMKDGTYVGQGEGFNGLVIVDLTIDGGKIADLQIRPHEETPFIADPALKTLKDSILATQSTDVDIVSGATFTSKALIKAVDQALQKASASFKDGVHTATVDGFGGPLKVEVTVSGGSITSVVVVEQDETPFIAKRPLEEIPMAIVEAQSWDVDAISGATVTSEAIMQAVELALSN
ncbi:MAG TPA: FMN-binding protein [Natronincola sp.]|nr:FMN-binding protein [Natronincola sp.]